MVMEAVWLSIQVNIVNLLKSRVLFEISFITNCMETMCYTVQIETKCFLMILLTYLFTLKSIMWSLSASMKVMRLLVSTFNWSLVRSDILD